MAVPGSAGVVMGLMGLGRRNAASMATLRAHALLVWLAVAAVAALGRRRRHGAPVLPAGLAVGAHRCASCCYACCRDCSPAPSSPPCTGRQATCTPYPGTWLLLYGCALICASAPTARIVAVLGALFVLLGMATLLLPDHWHNLALAAGFGGLHLIFGVLIARERHGNQS